MYEPNDEQDLTTIGKHKGRRYSFLAAIIDADRAVPEHIRNEEQKAKLLNETHDISQGGNKNEGLPWNVQSRTL